MTRSIMIEIMMLTHDNLIQCHDAQCQWRARALKPEFNLKVEFSGMTRDHATDL